ncbi:MAG: hypothetical protein IIW86_05840 [Clostridia bacterium]|nr:hypothetical protein [Clostridia bacterium]
MKSVLKMGIIIALKNEIKYKAPVTANECFAYHTIAKKRGADKPQIDNITNNANCQ